MGDRELLELAAKACGHAGVWHEWHDDMTDSISCGIAPKGACGRDWWNPLRDNGEALGLMVALNLDVNVGTVKTRAVSKPLDSGVKITVDHFGDPCQSTRIAIVRAAAEIGKTK